MVLSVADGLPLNLPAARKAATVYSSSKAHSTFVMPAREKCHFRPRIEMSDLSSRPLINFR
jgi:hypothetical protein